MTATTLARSLDAKDLPIAAAWAFERALRLNELKPSDYVALAFIYFNAGDFGYAAHHHLPQEFVDPSDHLWKSTLERGMEIYPEASEIAFWMDFFASARHADPDASRRLTERLESSNDPLAGGFWGFAFLERQDLRRDADALLGECRKASSSRNRYVAGVLTTRLA
ncbi:MAG: hypothetical protein KBF21_08015 [Thermoanaerobaculia bacterium]|nr:hypothetical protein [Thermoanaerobaculia bacterium]